MKNLRNFGQMLQWQMSWESPSEKEIEEGALEFIANKILWLEQEGEHLHQLFNSLENKYKSVSRREDRFWFILTEYENKLYKTDSLFQVKKRNLNQNIF